MHRRQFIASSLAASAVALTSKTQAEAPMKSREYYQLRRYQLQSGPQSKLTQSYFAEALIPALTRLGLGPVGAFRLEIGPETPVLYLLIPGPSVESLVNVDFHLVEDAAFLKAGESFWGAPETASAFVRVDSSLLSAFEGWPKVTLLGPAAGADKSKMVFQLRTYESPSYADHVRKVEMFNNGEFQIFVNAGFKPIFFGDTLIGPRQPQLTYMLSAPDMNQLNAFWDKFRDDPDWKKLSSSPRYAYEDIVSNISNLILSPLGCSQI